MSENPPSRPSQPEDPYGQEPQQPAAPQPPAHDPGGGYQAPYQQPADQPGGQARPGGEPFYASAASSAANVAVNDTRGLLGSLFDYSFNNYVTPKIVKIVYVIVTILIAINWLISLFVGVATLFSEQWYVGLGIILFGWIVALVWLAVWRIGLEVFQAVVNISEKVNHYARRDGVA